MVLLTRNSGFESTHVSKQLFMVMRPTKELVDPQLITYIVSTAVVILNQIRLHELWLEQEAIVTCKIMMVLKFEPDTYRIQAKYDESTGWRCLRITSGRMEIRLKSTFSKMWHLDCLNIEGPRPSTATSTWLALWPWRWKHTCMCLWNIDKFLHNYMASCPRR